MINEITAKFIASHLRARKTVLETTATPEMMAQLNDAIATMDDIANGNTIESGWSIEDVFSLTDDENYEFTYVNGEPVPPSDITVAQAREVLSAVDHNHDASIGINWDTLGYYLQEVRMGRA